MENELTASRLVAASSLAKKENKNNNNNNNNKQPNNNLIISNLSEKKYIKIYIPQGYQINIKLISFSGVPHVKP